MNTCIQSLNRPDDPEKDNDTKAVLMIANDSELMSDDSELMSDDSELMSDLCCAFIISPRAAQFNCTKS